MSPDDLADLSAIHDLTARYCRAIDDASGDAYAALFTADGTMESSSGPVTGRAALAELARRSGGRAIHTTLNPIVELDGDRARHLCTLIVYSRSNAGAPHAIRRIARYEDDLVRTPEGWRIAHRRMLDAFGG